MRRNGLTAIDLFAGAGGATQGLRNAGYRVVAAVESDARAVDTYRQNHSATVLVHSDIRSVDPAKLTIEAGIAGGQLTLLQACPPCQTWSSLGTVDRNDPRNDLVHEVTRFAAALRPKIIIIENVVGLANDVRFHHMRDALRRLGYGVRSYRVDASDWGVPQRRRRLIVVAVVGSDGRRFPRSLLDAAPRTFDSKRTTVGEAFARVPANAIVDRRNLAPLTRARIGAIPEGGTRFDLPDSLQLACHKRLPIRTATGAYGRMRRDDVAPTLTTRCTTVACGPFIHPTKDRPISLAEAAALQTFPPTYKFAGSHGAVERQIGNAIPVKLAEGIALAANKILLDTGSPY